jgi:membrane protease YdiL (CAAX protease family)
MERQRETARGAGGGKRFAQAGSRGVAAFFLLTFAWTWLLQAPAAAAACGWIPGGTSRYVGLGAFGIFGPTLVATVLTAREGGRAAVVELYARFLRWRVPLRYYLLGLVAPGLGLSALLWLLRLAGRDGPIAYLPSAPQIVVALIVAFGEEVGWRGFALPRLSERFGSFAASGIIGVVWMLWHIPMFVAAGVPLSLLVVMVLYFTGGSFLFTWLYEGSGGSLLIAFLAHVGAHLDNSHRALPSDVLPLVVHAIVYGVLGFALMRSSALAAFALPRQNRAYSERAVRAER